MRYNIVLALLIVFSSLLTGCSKKVDETYRPILQDIESVTIYDIDPKMKNGMVEDLNNKLDLYSQVVLDGDYFSEVVANGSFIKHTGLSKPVWKGGCYGIIKMKDGKEYKIACSYIGSIEFLDFTDVYMFSDIWQKKMRSIVVNDFIPKRNNERK